MIGHVRAVRVRSEFKRLNDHSSHFAQKSFLHRNSHSVSHYSDGRVRYLSRQADAASSAVPNRPRNAQHLLMQMCALQQPI